MPFDSEGEDRTVDIDPGASPRMPLPFVPGGSAAPSVFIRATEAWAPRRRADTLTMEHGVRPAASPAPFPFAVPEPLPLAVPAPPVEPREPEAAPYHALPAPPAAVAASPEPEPVAPPPPAKRLPDGVSLEEVAAIAAAIDQDPQARDAVLDAARLDAATLAEAQGLADRQIRADASRGSTAALARWDAAWVGAVERLRGPILPAEYAAISVAGERGTVGSSLADLGLGRGSLLPVERTFLRRMAVDLALYEQVVRAVAAARRAP